MPQPRVGHMHRFGKELTSRKAGPLFIRFQTKGLSLSRTFDFQNEEALVNMENRIVDKKKHRMTCRPVEVSGGKDSDGNVLTCKVEAGSETK